MAHTSNVGGGGSMGRKTGGKKKPKDPTELMDYMVSKKLIHHYIFNSYLVKACISLLPDPTEPVMDG